MAETIPKTSCWGCFGVGQNQSQKVFLSYVHKEVLTMLELAFLLAMGFNYEKVSAMAKLHPKKTLSHKTHYLS
jgi:hypothetical protein